MPYSTTITSLLSCILLAMQSCSPRLPTFVEVAHTTARGGDCERIVLTADGKHMLTVGEAGDLIWWDLPQRRLLRRIDSLGRYVTALAVHPSEPWVVVGTSPAGEWQGFVWRCDLDTGATKVLWSDYTRDLRFDHEGQQLHAHLRVGENQYRAVTYLSASLRGDAPSVAVPDEAAATAVAATGNKQVQSQDGRHTVTYKHAKLLRSGTEPHEYDLGAHIDTWIDNCAVADDGTIVAADLEGQLHVQGPADADHTLLSGHTGDACQLAFSPDGRYLAVIGLGATRIVDLTGQDVAEWWGTRIVQPGPEGADFWSFGRHELRRWSAATQRDVGSPRHWATPALRLLRSAPHSFAKAVAPTRNYHVSTLAAAGVVDGNPWLGSDEAYGLRAWRWSNGEFQHLEGTVGSTPIALLPRADGNVLFVTGRECISDLFQASHVWVSLFDGSGQALATWDQAAFPEWVAADPDSRVMVVGLDDGTVHALTTDTLAQLTSRKFEPKLEQATMFDHGRLLAANDSELLLLDASSLATSGTLALPADLGRIHAMAVSIDHRHLAVAHDSDVRILRIE